MRAQAPPKRPPGHGADGRAWPRWRIFLSGLFLLLCALWLLAPVAVLFLSGWREGLFARMRPLSAKNHLRLRALMGATLWISAGAVFLAVLFGVSVALAIQRARGWWRGLLCAAYPIPLLLPPAVVAIAWTHLLGKRGLAAAAWLAFSGEKALPFSIYGKAGSAGVLALCWFPLVTMSTLVGLRATGGVAAAAGRLYAGPWRRVWHIDAPLLLPYVSAGAVFVAWMVLGDFDVPSVFLLNAFPLEIFTAAKSYEMGRALVMCLPLLALSAGVLFLRQFLMRGSSGGTIGQGWTPDGRRGASRHAAPGTPGSSCVLQAASVLILGLAVAAPLASLIHQGAHWPVIQSGLRTAGGQILTSFRAALTAGLLLLAIGVPYARLLGRQRGWRRAALTLLALAPLAIPGTVHGLAWIAALSPTAWGRALLADPFILALANAARFFPFAVFLLNAAFEALHPGLLDAARAAGAGAWLRWRRVTFPLICPGLAAAFAITFALSLGELSASILLSPVGYDTLPVRIASLLHFGQDELVAALCLAQVFLALVPYLVATLFLERVLEVRLG